MSNAIHTTSEADREKRTVALVSVLAAVLLTGGKLAIGLWTNSLGILSEAAHSGLDLVAAVITLFAVRLSGRPADRDHTYGHGKVENLSALFETLLLLVTCVWIVYEAVSRLAFQAGGHVTANVWAFGVVLGSIGIDAWRSRALGRVAQKYQSQALEADALHFSTDIWSSGVVLVGLLGVVLAKPLGIPWLEKADAVAALGVSVIVVFVSYRLGRRAIDVLLDAVPPDLMAQVRAAAQVPGVHAVQQVRVRRSGPELFADITLEVDAHRAFEEAHEIASRAEKAVRSAFPKADVVIHMEPTGRCADIHAVAFRLAARHGMNAHALRVYDERDERVLDLHLELDEELSLGEAHDRATAFEQNLREALPEITRIVTHLEPSGEASATRKCIQEENASLRTALETIVSEIAGLGQPHDICLKRAEGELSLSFHCAANPERSLAQAHELTERLERTIRERIPGLGRVTIHVEPPEPTTDLS